MTPEIPVHLLASHTAAEPAAPLWGVLGLLLGAAIAVLVIRQRQH